MHMRKSGKLKANGELEDKEKLENVRKAIQYRIATLRSYAEFWKDRDPKRVEFYNGRIFELERILGVMK